MGLILHIPHASTFFPHRKGFIVSNEILQTEALKLSDLFTDELFFPERTKYKNTAVIAKFTRVFCDVERFLDDDEEVMARYGMGCVYTHSDDSELIREISPANRQSIIDEYFIPHHYKLIKAIHEELKLKGNALMIDCHSFPNKAFNRSTAVDDGFRPDICIGTHDMHTPPGLAELAVEVFASRGLTVGVNDPYEGALIPSYYEMSQPRVSTIMLEVNRKLYMNENTHEKLTSCGGFRKTQKLVGEFLEVMNKWVDGEGDEVKLRKQTS